ncbi:MAG: hypothetical protein KBE14_09570 [Ottowia sp.]|nr:hypothetical protein [Ottowia sp.]
MSDVTPFFSGFGGASQSPAIAQAFAHAALDPAGACKQPAAGVVDLAVSLTGPASLTPGTPANYLLRVANPGVVASTAITVTLTLPTGVTATGTPPVGCTFSSANTIVTCQLPDRSVARSSNLTIQLVAAGGAGGNAQPSVPAQTGEVNTANNNAALAIAIGAAPPSPTAVPTLDVWALFALGGLLPLVAARRRRQN